MIVIAIAMGRCAGGTQQVLVPLLVSIAAEDTTPGGSHGPRLRSILGEGLARPPAWWRELDFPREKKTQAPAQPSSAYDTEASAARQHAQH